MMTKKKINKTAKKAARKRAGIRASAPEVHTIKRAEQVMQDLYDAELALSELQNLEERDVQAVLLKYKSQIEQAKLRIKRLNEGLKGFVDNCSDLFDGHKTMKLRFGTLGVRVCPPSVKPLNGWGTVKALRSLMAAKWGAAFVNIKESIDKERILNDHKSGCISNAELEIVGLQVVQEEKFFAQPVTPDEAAMKG